MRYFRSMRTDGAAVGWLQGRRLRGMRQWNQAGFAVHSASQIGQQTAYSRLSWMLTSEVDDWAQRIGFCKGRSGRMARGRKTDEVMLVERRS